MFDTNLATIIRYSDCLSPGELQGQSLKSGCCQTNPRNLCKEGLAAEGIDALQEQMHQSLARFTDAVGAKKSNSAEVLVMFDFGSRGRVFALLVKGVFKPKMQMWANVVWSSLNACAEPPLLIEFPFSLELAGGHSRLSPGVTVPSISTSDELALALARHGSACRAFSLEWQEPQTDETLLRFVVTGSEECDFKPPPAQRRAPRNSELHDLRALGAGVAADRFFQVDLSARQRSEAWARGRRSGGRGRARPTGAESAAQDPLPLPPDAPDEGVDGLGHGVEELCDLPEADVAEMVGATISDEEARPDPDAPPVAGSSVDAPVVPPERPLISGPTALGYFRHEGLGRDIIRVSGPFTNNSMGVKCFQHPCCSLAMAQWKLPGEEKLKKWALSVRPATPADSPATARALATEHLALLRSLRDEAR